MGAEADRENVAGQAWTPGALYLSELTEADLLLEPGVSCLVHLIDAIVFRELPVSQPERYGGGTQ
jgi:hypothetical protein